MFSPFWLLSSEKHHSFPSYKHRMPFRWSCFHQKWGGRGCLFLGFLLLSKHRAILACSQFWRFPHSQFWSSLWSSGAKKEGKVVSRPHRTSSGFGLALLLSGVASGPKKRVGCKSQPSSWHSSTCTTWNESVMHYDTPLPRLPHPVYRQLWLHQPHFNGREGDKDLKVTYNLLENRGPDRR